MLKDRDNLVVVSSDLSHFYTQKQAKLRDYICLESVEDINSSRLKNGCEACGYRGIEALLIVAKKLGLKSTLLDYRTSASITKDSSSVVGYMSAVLSEK